MMLSITRQTTAINSITSVLSLLIIIILSTIIGLEVTSSHQHQRHHVAPPTAPFPSSSSTPQSHISCGSKPSSAKAAGCKFDPLSFSWLPPLCYDDDLITHFLGLKTWSWYLQPFTPPTMKVPPSNISDSLSHDHSTPPTPVPLDIVFSGLYDHMWVSREFHLYHCTYMWRKMHRAWARGGPMDSYIGNYSHTEHCEGVLVNDGPEGNLGVVDVQIQRKFVGCGMQGRDDVRKDLYRPVRLGGGE